MAAVGTKGGAFISRAHLPSRPHAPSALPSRCASGSRRSGARGPASWPHGGRRASSRGPRWGAPSHRPAPFNRLRGAHMHIVPPIVGFRMSRDFGLRRLRPRRKLVPEIAELPARSRESVLGRRLTLSTRETLHKHCWTSSRGDTLNGCDNHIRPCPRIVEPEYYNRHLPAAHLQRVKTG